jgi:Cu2+-exporting ATPase
MARLSLPPLPLPVSDLSWSDAFSIAANAMRLSVRDDPHEWSTFSRPLAQQPTYWESSAVFEVCTVHLARARLRMPCAKCLAWCRPT